MLNIKKVRYIRSAYGGTSLSPLLPPKNKLLEPYNWEEEMKGFIPMNPYMTSNGIAKPQSLMPLLQSKPVGSIAKSTDVATLNNNLQKIVANRDLSPKLGFFLNPTNMEYLNLGIGLANNMLFSGEENSSLTNGINLGWDTAADAVWRTDPVLGTFMKGITLTGNSLKSIGGGTDQMTTTDLILDSAPMTFLTMGLNGFLGSKTQNFSANKLTIELVGGSYGGSVKNINDAASKARKKYGIASSGSKKIVNNQIDAARGWQNTMTDIATEATDLSAIATDRSQLNHLNYNFNLNGGYDLRYMRAKDGGKLARIKKLSLSKFKTGGTISGSVNLETKEIEWQPTIIEEVELFEEGGTIWSPVILESGGKTKEKPKAEELEVEETTLKNIIPEGALHAHKHHMENSEGLTLKGIPVVDEDGEQLAEIEKNEIIFTLEVTKKLEELYSKYTELPLKEKDEVAIEAGKLLVEQVLFNTEDRTGLISTLEKGGVIDGPK